MNRLFPLLAVAGVILAGGSAFGDGIRAHGRPIPVVLDTDIGTDIDDAFALALVMRSPELRLLGVTTVSGDAVARARIAAKLLATAGGRWAQVPVYAGTSGPAQSMAQAKWAEGFSSPALHTSGGVAFLRRTIRAHPGELTLIAIGELTNVAALLRSDPSIRAALPRIALMGGAIHRGYAPGSPAQPEWNIKSNIAAAQVVFRSGIPLLVAPLDAGADLRLSAKERSRLFAAHTALTDALRDLCALWEPQASALWHQRDPILWDPATVGLVVRPGLFVVRTLPLRVDDRGLTRIEPGGAMAEVAVSTDVDRFLGFYLSRVSGP